MVAATIAVVATAHAASEADRAMMRAYADTMTNAIPTLLQGEEEMEKDCSSTSGPSGVSSCIHGLDFGGAGVRTVRSRMSSLKVPDCLRGVDAKLLTCCVTVTRRPRRAWSRGCRWVRRCLSGIWRSLYSGMRDIEIGNEKLSAAIALLKGALVTCLTQ